MNVIRFNSVWITTPAQAERYSRQLALPAGRQDEDFPRMRMLLSRKLIPFFAYGQLTLGDKEAAFESLNPTFSSVAVYQFYNLNRRFAFSYQYGDLIVRKLPQPVPNPLPVYGDWVSIASRSSSVEYWLASSSPGAQLYPWLVKSGKKR